MKLSKEAIKEIADQLYGGMVCYINKQTHDIISIFDSDDFLDCTGCLQEEIEEIEKNPLDYVRIEKMSSRESYQIMEEFAELVPDIRIKERLFYALGQSKPFRKFKYEVEYDMNIREQWFKFKADRYEDWVGSYFEELEIRDNE